MDHVVQWAHQQELTYLIFKLSIFRSFTLSSLLFKKRLTQEQRVQTLYSYYLLPSQGKDRYIFRMTPSKYMSFKPKEVSLDPSFKVETPTVELPNDGNKLFDEDVDVGTTTIPDLSLPSEDEDEEVKSSNVWEYAIDVLFKLSPIHCQGNASENGSNIKTWNYGTIVPME